MPGKKKLTDELFSTAGFALLIIVFLIDLETAIGVADGMLYIAVLFLFIAVSDTMIIALAGMVAIMLVIAGYFISPRPEGVFMETIGITNRIFSVTMLIIGDLLIIKYRMSINILRVKMQELKDFKYALDEAAMVAITDGQGKILKVNEKFCEISQYTREDLVGRNHSIINSGEHAEKFIEELEKTVLQKKPLKGEFINRAKDGSYYWIDTTIVPFVNEEGEIYQYVAIGTDVSVRKQAEEQVIRQKEELEKFLYISSHDLQEPLRKIQSFTSMILEKEKSNLSDRGKLYLDKLNDAVRQSRSLIQDLVVYSDFNKSIQELEPTDLDRITEKVKAELKETIEEKHATIEFMGSCRPNVIYFQFYQLILNLISNALKFSNPQVPPHITIKCRLVKGRSANNQLSPDLTYCHITVKDNGIGFPSKDKKKIFEIFRTLHGKEKYAGTGIGLAIVKRIVENHKGIITASSELNKGATFDIYIPAPESACQLELGMGTGEAQSVKGVA